MERRDEISNEMLEESIFQRWYKYINERNYTPSEATYYLLDNLYRLIENNPEFIKITYRSLIILNEREKNLEIVDELKQEEVAMSKQGLVESSNFNQR